MTKAKKPNPKRKPPAAVKAAADRAEARSAGKPMPEPKASADVGPTQTELAEGSQGRQAQVRKQAAPGLLGRTGRGDLPAHGDARPDWQGAITHRSLQRGPDMPCEESVRSWRREHPAFGRSLCRSP